MRISKQANTVVKPLTKEGIYTAQIIKQTLKKIDEDLSLIVLTIEYVDQLQEVSTATFIIREAYEDYYLQVFACEYTELYTPLDLIQKLIEDKKTLQFQLSYKGSYVNWIPIKK